MANTTKDVDDTKELIKLRRLIKKEKTDIEVSKDDSKKYQIEIFNFGHDCDKKREEISQLKMQQEKLEREIKEAESKVISKTGERKSAKDRIYQEYSSQILSNFYEFGKFKQLFEIKERERVEVIEDSTGLQPARFSSKASMSADQLKDSSGYSKPGKAVISVTYLYVLSCH